VTNFNDVKGYTLRREGWARSTLIACMQIRRGTRSVGL
jgi:hypothetical protein